MENYFVNLNQINIYIYFSLNEQHVKVSEKLKKNFVNLK